MGGSLRVLLLVVAGIVGGSGVAASGALAAPTLAGQTVLANGGIEGHTSTFSGTCNQAGISTFRFKVTGTARGPFQGSFVETGTFTLGPLLPLPDGNVVATPLAFASAFVIRSPTGTVVGAKTLSSEPLVPYNFGACGTGVFFGFPDGVAIQLRANYVAVVTHGRDIGSVRGTSFVDYGDIGARPTTGINPFQFFESYS